MNGYFVFTIIGQVDEYNYTVIDLTKVLTLSASTSKVDCSNVPAKRLAIARISKSGKNKK